MTKATHHSILPFTAGTSSPKANDQGQVGNRYQRQHQRIDTHDVI
jgi:hypothetical protein